MRRAAWDTDRLIWAAIGLLLILRIALSDHMIHDPGIQMDEGLFVNAATLRLPGIWITHSFDGIPLMVFPYIGALKSWIYDPVFAILGNSPTTIRMPVVAITSAGLLLIYPAVRDLVNRPVALLVFVVLCFDNSLFWLTRDDVGPSAITFFLECAAIFCAARWARAPRARWIGLLVVVLALGVFNKLNFIWIVNAAVVISAVVIARHRAALRRHVRELVVWCAGLAALYACFAAYYITNRASFGPGGVGLGVVSYTWPQFQIGTRAILSGTWFYGYALNPLAPRDTVVVVVLALFAAGAIGAVLPGRTLSLTVGMFVVATILIAFQILITSQATAGWHYIFIYPFVIMVAAYGAYALADLLLRAKVRVAVALACVGAMSLAYSGTLMAKYFHAIARETINPAWDARIYQLDTYVRSRRGTVFTADWGFFNSLFALDPSPRYRELEFALESSDPRVLSAVAEQVASTPGPKLIVTHGPAKLVFPDADTNLLLAMGSHLHVVKVFSENDGTVLYEVYVYR